MLADRETHKNVVRRKLEEAAQAAQVGDAETAWAAELVADTVRDNTPEKD